MSWSSSVLPCPNVYPLFRSTLATAIPKGDRFDWLVEKATELGVERLIPIITDRSVVDPRDSKLTRLRRSIIEASKQCRRARLMIAGGADPLARAGRVLPGGLKFVADPEGLPPLHWPEVGQGQPTILAVGPEGGFTATERELAERRGWLAIRLSVNILRIETAGLAGCAALLTRNRQESNE